MKVVPKIKRSGYPVYTKAGRISRRYEKAHRTANRATLKRFGAKTAKAVNKVACKKGELLGTHTKRGKIKVSSKVPKKLRRAIAYHEAIEHRIMAGKNKR